MTAAAVRAGTLRIMAAVAVSLALAVGISRASAAPPADPVEEITDARPISAELIDVDYPGPGLLALRQWTPTRDVVLMCENYERLLPMRPADLWVDATVPASGRVLLSVSAETSNSEDGLGDYWGIMVGDEVVATGRAGVGDIPHRVTARFVIDDLPPGEVVRFDVAHRSDEGGTANIYLGPTHGPAVLEVWSA
jgi:hypothetical protein